MFKLIRSKNQLEAISGVFDKDQLLFCDTETALDKGRTLPSGTGHGGLYGKVRLFQVYQAGMKEAYLFDCLFLELSDVLDMFQDFHHVYHNASYDLHTINCYTPETWLPRDVDDTFYLSKAKYTSKDKFDFYSCLSYAGLADDNIMAIDKKAEQKSDWSKVLTPQMLKYAAYDVLYLSLLYADLAGSEDEVYKMDIKNLKYAIHYDRKGLPIDRNTIARLRSKTLLKLEGATANLTINYNSPKQCKHMLGVDSTTAAILGDLALAELPVSDTAKDIVDARVADKFLGFLNSYDRNRVYGFHNAAGARTGRMTCAGGDRIGYENTQQPPRKMLQCISAPKGKKLVYNDYSGLELRIAIAYVGEPRMEKMMREGGDMHAESASIMFGIAPGDLDIEQRTVGKFFNFGTAYGAGPGILRDGLISRGGVRLPIGEINTMRTKWLDYYSYFKEWHEMHKRHYNIYGYMDIVTGLGRTIRCPRLNDSFNYAIQGTAAECTKLAVQHLHERYGEPDIINVVHDSICLEKYEDEAEVWVDRLDECMQDAWYYCIKDFAIPDMPMPKEAEVKQTWAKLEV